MIEISDVGSCRKAERKREMTNLLSNIEGDFSRVVKLANDFDASLQDSEEFGFLKEMTKNISSGEKRRFQVLFEFMIRGSKNRS